MIKIIAAVGRGRELGANNALLWNLPEDMKFFRETTRGQTVIMGRLTYESIGRPLPNRRNIVITSHGENMPAGVEVCGSLDEAIDLANGDAFIIGGARVYKDAIALADEIILTEIDADFPQADVYFPEFDKTGWTAEIIAENSDGGINYRHVRYRRPN